MFRILMISELRRFNNASRGLVESIDLLKTFLLDESTEVFLEGENHIFGCKEDFIKANKHSVATLDKAKIEVRSNEHAPAHFHVRIGEFEAAYEILTCNRMEGNIPARYEKKIIVWFKNGGKEKLIQKWNITRPENCPVGEIR